MRRSGGHRFIRHHQAASLVGARNGAMGLAVPAAVAASLTFPDRRAVAICGDGDFLMNGQEIATAFAHGATPLIIVIDNGVRSEEHTSELQSRGHLVCRLLLEKKNSPLQQSPWTSWRSTASIQPSSSQVIIM